MTFFRHLLAVATDFGLKNILLSYINLLAKLTKSHQKYAHQSENEEFSLSLYFLPTLF